MKLTSRFMLLAVMILSLSAGSILAQDALGYATITSTQLTGETSAECSAWLKAVIQGSASPLNYLQTDWQIDLGITCYNAVSACPVTYAAGDASDAVTSLSGYCYWGEPDLTSSISSSDPVNAGPSASGTVVPSAGGVGAQVWTMYQDPMAPQCSSLGNGNDTCVAQYGARQAVENYQCPYSSVG
jgi:hypothetical protein